MANSTVNVFNPIAGSGGLASGDLFYVFRPAITDLDFKATPADVLLYVENNATTFANVAHTHVLADITNAGSLAGLNAITDAEIAIGAGISLSKLAVDPLARANHTGTQLMSTISDAGALANLNTVNLSLIDAIAADNIVGSDNLGNIIALTPNQILTLLGVSAGADVTNTTNVNASGAVMETDYNANTLLKADSNNTPSILNVAANRLVGRKSTGGISALTPNQILTLLGVSAGAQPNEFSFKTISVPLQTDVVADGVADTLNLVGGTNIAITTDSTTDTITITSTASGIGDVIGPGTHSDNKLARWNGINSNILDATNVAIDDLNNMTGISNISLTGLVDGRDVAVDGTKLDGIASGAEVNQNAFKIFKVSGQSDVVADVPTDILNITAGANVQILTDAITDTITISVPSLGALGDVFAPTNHVNDIIPIWNGIDTKTLKNSSVSISPLGNMTGISNISLTGLVDGRDVAVDGTKLDGIASGAEVNQNAFEKILVSGQPDVVADSSLDSLNLVGGTNITLTTDPATDTITIASTTAGTGDVIGPTIHGDNILARFNGIDTNTIQVTGIIIDDLNNMTGISNISLTGLVDGRDVAVDGTKLDTIQSGAQLTNASSVNAAGAVMETDFSPFTIMAADLNNTPFALGVPASSFVGRKSTGGIVSMSAPEALVELGVSVGAEPNQNAFQTFVVAGENDIVADNPTDIFTFIAGTNVTLTTSPTGDALVINSAIPAGAGDVVGPATHAGNVLPIWNGTDTKILKSSGVSVDVSNNMTGIGNISLTGLVDGRDVAVDGTKLDGIALGAQPDQNLFSTISVATQIDVVADLPSDVLTLASGLGTTITTDSVTDTITFSANFADFGTLATLNNISDAEIAIGAGISLSKLAVDPLARVNHTGTQLMSTISDSGLLSTKNLVSLSDMNIITANNIIGSDVGGNVVALSPGQVSTLIGIIPGAQPNQNAFSTVSVATQADVVADLPSDALTFIAGTGIAITTDPISDSVTFAVSAGSIPIFSQSFVSNDEFIVPGGLISLEHGMTLEPKIFVVRLINVITEAGWLPGDSVDISSATQGDSSHGVVTWGDLTNINLRIGNDPTPIIVLDKNTGEIFHITPANWAIRITAYA